MNELVAVIAAIVGSSGLASILAGATQFRRTHRLQAQLKELDAAKNLVQEASRERAALEASMATVALELAAYILIRGDVRRLVLLGLVGTSFIGAVLIVFGSLPHDPLKAFGFREGDVNMPLVVAGIVVLMSGYIALYVYVYLRLTAGQRSKLIHGLLSEPEGLTPAEVLRVSREMTDYRPTGPRKAATSRQEAVNPK